MCGLPSYQSMATSTSRYHLLPLFMKNETKFENYIPVSTTTGYHLRVQIYHFRLVWYVYTNQILLPMSRGWRSNWKVYNGNLFNQMIQTNVLEGPDHMALSISPLPGNTLISWSFLNTPPLARSWGSRQLYYMMLIYGLDINPINFYLDIEVGKIRWCVAINCLLCFICLEIHKWRAEFRYSNCQSFYTPQRIWYRWI